jgi:uncharacterized protein YozE (UPF0346 family)
MTNGWGSKKKAGVKHRKTKAGAKRVGRTRNPAYQDQRFPVHDDPDSEIVCKWIAASGGYQCRQVKKGRDWTP